MLVIEVGVASRLGFTWPRVINTNELMAVIIVGTLTKGLGKVTSLV